MTNEEKDRLIAYLVDAGEIDPEGDVEAQFLEWRQVHEQVVSGEVHYKAILEAARIRKRSFDRGYQAGCAAMLGPMTAVRPARLTIRSIIRSSASVPRSVRHAGAGRQPQPWADRPGQRQVGNPSAISGLPRAW